jgi:hypothetical protein
MSGAKNVNTSKLKKKMNHAENAFNGQLINNHINLLIIRRKNNYEYERMGKKRS